MCVMVVVLPRTRTTKGGRNGQDNCGKIHEACTKRIPGGSLWSYYAVRKKRNRVAQAGVPALAIIIKLLCFWSRSNS